MITHLPELNYILNHEGLYTMKITTYIFILSAFLFWNCQPNNTIPESNTINTKDSSEESSESSESSSSEIESSESSSSSTDESSSKTESSAIESSEMSSSDAEPTDQPSSSDESSVGTSSEASSVAQSSESSTLSSSLISSSIQSSASIVSSSSVSPIATGNLHVEFDPTTYGGKYYYKDNKKANLYAVFIIAEDGTFIKTIEARGIKEISQFELWLNYLGNNEPDGITGATVRNHDKRSIDWDLKDRDGTTVDKGTYYLHMAYTEDNYEDYPGVEHSTQFIISGEESTVTDNSEFFEDISIVHTP